MVAPNLQIENKSKGKTPSPTIQTSNGHCEDSPDRSSLAESKESGGECNWNGYCVAEHTAVDFVPAVADDLAEPFREIGSEMMKAFDWRNWQHLAYGY